MATGVIFDNWTLGYDQWGTYPNLNQFNDQPPWPPNQDVPTANDVLQGPFTENRPIELLALSDFRNSGSLVTTSFGSRPGWFVDDYYNRIYINPARLDLGNLIGNVFRTFDVWNAYFIPQENSALNVVGDDTGIILNQPEVPPTTFGALEVRQYEITFDLNGPASIVVDYNFVFPSETAVLPTTGNRVILWGFAPDWSQPVTESYEWLTQIVEVEEGTEDRYRLRQVPRRSIEYQMLMQTREKRWLERYMWSWKGRTFSVPIWTDCTITTSETPIGSLTIDVVTTDYTSFRAGGIAMFVDGYNNLEAVDILSVTANQITLNRANLKAWPAGSKIFPALTGRLTEDVTINWPTADIDIGTVRFEFEDNTALPATDAPEAFLDGFALTKSPNRAEDVSSLWQTRYDIADFGIATPFVEDRAGFPDHVIGYSFAEGTREQIWFWKEWLHARAGRWSKFYMPSWSRDFTPVATIEDSDLAVEVEDNEYRNFYALAEAKRNMAIHTNDGLIYLRRITGAAEKAPEGSDIEVLNFDSQLGTQYTVDQIKMIGFLHPVRLDSDRIDIVWDHTRLARLSFNVRVIPQ